MASKTPLTPQEVIQKFMNSLIHHGYTVSDNVGIAMLDSAIKASSRFFSVKNVIDSMMEDQVAAEKEAVEAVLGSEYAGKTLDEIETTEENSTIIKSLKANIFLEKYCGIQLNKEYSLDANGTVWVYNGETGNVDTGAITGSDANISLKSGDTDYYGYGIDINALAKAYGDKAKLSGDTLIIGTGTEKTDRSIVPEIFVNTYTASTDAAQNINTGTRDWVVQATDYKDSITSGGADSINAGGGDDTVTVNGEGATISSGEGKDTVEISSHVKNVILNDLTSDDVVTINGTFEIGAITFEDNLLVVTDTTGTRKIKLDNYENALSAKVNVNGTSQTIINWLIESGIDLYNIQIINYAESIGVGSSLILPDKAVSDSGRTAIDPEYTPSPLKVETRAPKKFALRSVKPVSNFNTANDTAVTVNLDDYKDLSDGASVTFNGQSVGTVSSTYPGATTFTRNGLTIHLLGFSSSTSGDPTDINGNSLITPITSYDQLTEDQKTIIAGLFKWWGSESLQLSEDSYGVNASFNSDKAAVKDIGLYFFNGDENCGSLATVWSWGTNALDGKATKLMLNVNMSYYKNLNPASVDGDSNVVGASLLDRTLAHEFTHAFMASNINYFALMPQFITEGIAELTHGIDDERGNAIFKIAADNAKLAENLGLSNTEQDSQSLDDIYAGGYMFFRYFAKQAALQTLNAPALGDITANVNLAKFKENDILYVDNEGNVSTNNSGILLGGILADQQGDLYYQVVDNGVKQIITTSETIHDVYGVTSNVEIIGYKDYDGVEIVEGGTKVNTGGGNDFVQVMGQYATINTGDGNDYIYIYDGGHQDIDLGDGNNQIEIQGAFYNSNSGNELFAYNFNNTIIGGADGDTLANATNVVYVDYEGNTHNENELYYYDGSNFYTANQIDPAKDYTPCVIIYNEDYPNGAYVLATAKNAYYYNEGYKVDLGDGQNRITLSHVFNSDIKTGKDMDIVSINYASNVHISTGATADFVSLGSGADNVIDTEDDNDIVALNIETSTVKTGAGDDYIIFGTLNESLQPTGYYSNLIDMGDGEDIIDFAGSNNTIIGGAGKDYIRQINGSNGGNAYHFDGTFGADSIEGFMSNDTIHIDKGNTFEYANNILTVKDGENIKGTIEIMSGSFNASANVIADLPTPVPLNKDDQDNYLINNAEDLAALANYVGKGNNCAGLTFKITANIDVEGATAMSEFAGTVDGDGKLLTNVNENIFGNGTVSNLYYRGTATINGATKVYTLALPSGVTASDATVTIDNVDYYSGNVTLTIGTGAAVGNVTGIDNTAADSNGQIAFDIASDVAITAENIFYAVTVNGAEISSGSSITVGNADYYRGTISLTAKTGYTVTSSSVTVTAPQEINATFDTTNHYAFKSGNTYTLATANNTKDYPDLVQVYQLNLPDNVTAQGNIIVNDNGTVYAAGNVTLKAAAGYELSNITVNGVADDDGTFNITGDTTVTADVTVLADEPDVFNRAGTGVVVNSAMGDFSANSTLYSITASRENSTLIGNAKNNAFIISGGGTNILTGGLGNDLFKFSESGGIVTDYGIDSTKSGNGTKLSTTAYSDNPNDYARGTDTVKINGKVTGIYFEREGDTKTTSNFTATITYNDTNNTEQVIVLKDVAKKPTKTGNSPIYQTNDVAAQSLKIWDTSGSKQALLPISKLRKLFIDDDNLTDSAKAQSENLSALVDGNKLVSTNDFNPLNMNNPNATPKLTFTGNSKK